jgi:rhodanese-related sulfurtransferase
VASGSVKTTMLGLYLTSLQAAEALAKYDDILLVDVRPLAAVERDGLAAPTHKVVPLFVASTSSDVARYDAARAQINPRFLSQIEALTGPGPEGRRRTIIVICPDGSHSAIAVDHLADNGYGNVYLIVDGAAGSSQSVPGAVGWRRHGLPWIAKPRPEQVDR